MIGEMAEKRENSLHPHRSEDLRVAPVDSTNSVLAINEIDELFIRLGNLAVTRPITHVRIPLNF